MTSNQHKRLFLSLSADSTAPGTFCRRPSFAQQWRKKNKKRKTMKWLNTSGKKCLYAFIWLWGFLTGGQGGLACQKKRLLVCCLLFLKNNISLVVSLTKTIQTIQQSSQETSPYPKIGGPTQIYVTPVSINKN